MAIVSIVSVKLPTGDGVCCGVSLEPYLVLKKGDSIVSPSDIDEGGPKGGQCQLRSRWFRSTTPSGGVVCAVHPEREANLQCILCLKSKIPTHFSYHCSPECLRSNWKLHLNLHEKAGIVATRENGSTESPLSSSKLNSVAEKNCDKWIEVGKSRIYTPTSDDIGHVLKYEATIVDFGTPANGKQGIEILGKVHAATTSRVRPAPTFPVRNLISLGNLNQLKKPNATNGSKFTILTYNVLADMYTQQDHFSSPSWMLQWNYRKHNLLQELLTYMPDIMCLQEVQNNHYDQFWVPELSKAGYVGVYKNKAGTVYKDNRLTTDGCATFFRSSKFSLRKKYEVEFNQATKNLEEAKQDPQLKKAIRVRFMKDNVALLTVLEFNEQAVSGRKLLLCVANTHIHANPELTDVKIWQVHTLLKGLEKIKFSADIPMLVAGDFNSVPGSAVHSLLVRGEIDNSLIASVNDPLNALKEIQLHHELQLSSAVSALATAVNSADSRSARQKQRIDSKHKEPLFTNLGRDFKGTLDYIFYTHKNVLPTALLELPLEADLQHVHPSASGSSSGGGNGGVGSGAALPELQLPNALCSSDHISLMAEFLYCPQPQTQQQQQQQASRGPLSAP